MIVFGILERHREVYTEIVPNAAKKPPQAAWPSIASSIRTAGGAMMGRRIEGTKSISV